MQSITLSPPTLLATFGLLLALAGTDAFLTLRVREQKAALATFVGRQDLLTPSAGSAVPLLTGTNLKTGRGYTLSPEASPPLAILFFREGCHYCDQNWKQWDTLFSNGQAKAFPILLTEDKTLSDAYRQKHPMLSGPRVIVGADPKVLEALKLTATPQTLYLVHGRLKKDWVGVLSDDDVKEVQAEMLKPVE